jgi:hypothetical protein
VSDLYKDYYSDYLKSVDARLVGYSSVLAPATAGPAAATANPAPEIGSARIAGHLAVASSGAEGEGPGLVGGPVLANPAPTPVAAPIPEWAARNRAIVNFPCTEIEAAKTEAFLGIHSASTMSAAIKDSESDDPNKRIAAAVIFSYLGTDEAEKDLKTLSSDANPGVAVVANRAASFGEDPGPQARKMRRENTYIK